MGGKSPKTPPTDNMPSRKLCETCGRPINDHSINEVIECAKHKG